MAAWLRPQPGTDFRLLSFPDARSVSSWAWRRSREMPRLREDTRESRSGVWVWIVPGSASNPAATAISLFKALSSSNCEQQSMSRRRQQPQAIGGSSDRRSQQTCNPDSGRSRFNCRQYQTSILFEPGTARLRIVCNRSHRYCSADSTKGKQKVWSVLARGNGGKSPLYSAGRSDFAAAIIAAAISRLLLNSIPASQ